MGTSASKSKDSSSPDKSRRRILLAGGVIVVGAAAVLGGYELGLFKPSPGTMTTSPTSTAPTKTVGKLPIEFHS